MALARQACSAWRERVSAGEEVEASKIVPDITARGHDLLELAPRQVVNATGTILHTNLGRAPLALSARDAIRRSAGYVSLDYDLSNGTRGSRNEHVETHLTTLLGSEAATFVVNNAAGMLLSLTALAKRKEVLVSRGESVEIGDGFRVPELLQQSGARLREVGTTNRTYVADFATAIGERTGAILAVHTSNFAIVGFTERVPLSTLADLAHARGLLMLVDNGSGALVDTAAFGLAHEPTPVEALRAGADLVMFSTDKLLGGPQGGVIAGRKELIDRVRRHPLARALRPDKTAVAALRATLQEYLRGRPERIPVVEMMAQSSTVLHERAERVVRRLNPRSQHRVEIVECESTVGGGSLPAQILPSVGLQLTHTLGARRLAAKLRAQAVPVVGRIHRRHVVLDLRTVLSEEDELLALGIDGAFSPEEGAVVLRATDG